MAHMQQYEQTHPFIHHVAWAPMRWNPFRSAPEMVSTQTRPYATRNKVSIFTERDNKQICCIKHVNITNRKCQMISSVLMVLNHLSFLPPQSQSTLINRFPRSPPGLSRPLWSCPKGPGVPTCLPFAINLPTPSIFTVLCQLLIFSLLLYSLFVHLF